MPRIRFAALVAAAAAAITLTATPAVAQPARTFSSAELAATRATIDTRLASPPAGVTGWGVDPASGRMVVSVLRGDRVALSAARHATAGLPAAKISYVTERPRLLYNLVGGQAIYVSGSRCSIGFSARSSSGAAYVITAGHCTKLGGTWAGYNQVTIGPTAGVNFPSDDFGSIRVNSTSTWAPTATVQNGPSVQGSTVAAIGAQVCRSGSTTGYHCGVVQALNQTVNYGGGNVVSGLTRTNACAEPGDSGGTFITPAGQAQGMTSGGSGNCTSGGTTYFQPVNEALSRYGLTLVTASTPPPAPTVTLCSDVNYAGRCDTVSTNNADMRYTGTVGNDTLSSIKVPAGSWLKLYLDVNYTGTCQAFSGDVATLSGTTIGNDTVSSYQIATSAGSCPTS